MMNIGIDIDGVLVDMGAFLRTKAATFFYKKYKMRPIRPDAYYVDEMFGCTRFQSKEFWSIYGLSYLTMQPCIDGSREIIRKLHDEGHRIVLITSRIYTIERGPAGIFARTCLKNWLRRKQIYYDDISYCSDESSPKEKLAACHNHQIDIMVDDNAENILALKDSVFTICYDSPWNRSLEDERIVRAYSWPEIYDAIHDRQHQLEVPLTDEADAMEEV